MNLQLSRRTDLAIRALAALARTGDRRAGADLADAIGTTTPFLPQILGPLVKAGWIDSERGPGGGYLALVDLDEVSMLEVIEATEGSVETGRCVLRDGPCPGTQGCPVHEAWLSARAVLVDALGGVTLAAALIEERS
jgi:Rrf2 family iron-sulfur cluster assembly transcriptional regulator